jgi:tripartite-type tricarboxylate transporter receptor subunit TctC
MTPPKLEMLAAAACVCVIAGAPECAAQPSFEHQTIRLMIGTSSGGPLDLLGRQVAPHVAARLPGKPQIIVENRPGAASLVATNYVAGLAKPDGRTIGLVFGIVTQGLVGGSNIKFDLAKLGWVGAVSQTQVMLARKDLGIKSPRDLLKPAKPLVLATVGSTTPTNIADRLFLGMIGAKYRLVVGYPGQNETVLAATRGEANVVNAGHSLYLARRQSLEREGVLEAILQRGEMQADGTFRRNRQLPDIPTMVEAVRGIDAAALKGADFATYQNLVGALAVQYSFILPTATPRELLDVMRKALSTALNDPKVRATIQASMKSDYDFVDGETSEHVVKELQVAYARDARIGRRLKELMEGK